MSAFANRAKATWARLIRKVYEADPLVCPKCKGPMRVISTKPALQAAGRRRNTSYGRDARRR